jgi:hypothetical protein
VQRKELRRVQTEEDFREVLRAERAALFFWCDWSVNPMNAEPVLACWAREDRPAFGVFLVELDRQPYVRRWLADQGLDNAFHPYERAGTVVWLRRGVIVAEQRNNGPCRPADLRLRTREAFASRR